MGKRDRGPWEQNQAYAWVVDAGVGTVTVDEQACREDERSLICLVNLEQEVVYFEQTS